LLPITSYCFAEREIKVHVQYLDFIEYRYKMNLDSFGFLHIHMQIWKVI